MDAKASPDWYTALYADDNPNLCGFPGSSHSKPKLVLFSYMRVCLRAGLAIWNLVHYFQTRLYDAGRKARKNEPKWEGWPRETLLNFPKKSN